MSTTEDPSSHASRMPVQRAPGLWRTDLQQHDLSVPGREVIKVPYPSHRAGAPQTVLLACHANLGLITPSPPLGDDDHQSLEGH